MPGKLTAQDRDAIAAQALALLADPRFASLFAPGSRAEVPLVGTLPRTGLPPYAVTGQVDRLLVGAAEVLIADYKTNRPAPTGLEIDVPRLYTPARALPGAAAAHLSRPDGARGAGLHRNPAFAGDSASRRWMRNLQPSPAL